MCSDFDYPEGSGSYSADKGKLNAEHEAYVKGFRDGYTKARRKGHWIKDRDGKDKAACSECGEMCATYAMGKPRDQFCLWCGADMRGDPDET